MTKQTNISHSTDSAVSTLTQTIPSESREGFQMQVRLTDAEDYPQHVGTPGAPRLNYERWPLWRGKLIWVGAPVAPTKFHCGTDVVWPVVDAAALADIGMLHRIGEVFVCRHQIQVGD